MMHNADSLPANRDWLRAAVEQNEGPLVQYAARLLGDADRARDVVQDVFLQLCRQPREQVESRVRPWLFAVCRHRALDVLKKEARMRPLTGDLIERGSDGQSDPQTVLERRETAGRATAVLNRLPENQREVIRLKVQHGMSYREISDVTGLSVSNVGYLLHTGLTSLRRQLLAGALGD